MSEKIRDAIRQPSFTVMTVFLSLTLILQVINSVSNNRFTINILAFLICIAMWAAKAEANQRDVYLGAGLRLASGTYFAMYIIFWVVIALLAILGVLMFTGKDMIAAELEQVFDIIAVEYPAAQTGLTLTVAIMAIVVIAFVVLVFINLVYVRKVHNFIKSLRYALGRDECEIRHANGTKVWMLIIGIIQVLSVLMNLSAGIVVTIGNACLAAAYISAFVWINQNFRREQVVELY